MMTKACDYYSVATAASAALMLFLPSLLLHCAAANTVYVVGDTTGWVIPPNINFYATWASFKTFSLNDTLTFNFTSGRHDVVEVPKESYDSCSDDNMIGNTINTGPYDLILNKTGSHYFICSIGDHCQRGQKLTITVLSSSAMSPESAPPPPSSGSTRVLAGFVFIMLSLALGKLVL